MDDGVSLITGVVLFLVLIIIDFIFNGFSAAIQFINESNIEKSALDGDKKSEQLLSIINNPSNTITSLHIVSTLVSTAIGAFVSGCIYNNINNLINIPSGSVLEYILRIIIVLLMMLIITTVGIIIPVKIASRNSLKWAYSLVSVIRIFSLLITPFTFIITLLFNPNDTNDDVTEEEIMSMVNEGHEQGVLLASEAEMINNIFELGDKNAKDIMIHRKNIVAVECNEKLDDVLDFILTQNYSRFPVYEEDIDNIIGILHLKDVMRAHQEGIYNDTPIKNIKGLIREVSLIPETRDLNILFKNMQNLHNHMVIVVDEYGQTAGLVAMEDILEEIVGNILDEYDEDLDMIRKINDDTYLMNGMAPLEEVLEILDINCDGEELDEFDTLNGLLISLFDKIPANGEKFEVEFKGYLFEVQSTDNKIIKEVVVKKLVKDNDLQEEINDIIK